MCEVWVRGRPGTRTKPSAPPRSHPLAARAGNKGGERGTRHAAQLKSLGSNHLLSGSLWASDINLLSFGFHIRKQGLYPVEILQYTPMIL